MNKQELVQHLLNVAFPALCMFGILGKKSSQRPVFAKFGFGLLGFWTLMQFMAMLREPRPHGLHRQFWESETAVAYAFLVLVFSALVYFGRRSNAFGLFGRDKS